jgi:hypothetical protein
MNSFADDTKATTPQTDVISIFYQEPLARAQGLKSYQDLVGLVRDQPVGAKIYLSRHRPEAPTVVDPNSRIEFSLQQIQFNQTRLGVGP